MSSSNQKRSPALLYALGLICLFGVLSGRSAVPPAEQLLPADAMAMVSVPDWDNIAKAFTQSAYGQLWADPAIKAFKEKFLTKLQAEILTSLQTQLGIKLADYKDFLHGQLTIALTPPPEKSERDFSFLLLIDTKDKKDLLRSRLDELKKKWIDSGQKIRIDKIRDLEFTAIVINSEDLDKIFEQSLPEPEKTPAKKLDLAKKPEKYELIIGQSDTLLIIGNDHKDIEKILIRQSSGLVTPLADEPAFQNVHGSLPRNATAFGWLNFKPIYNLMLRSSNDPAQKRAPLGAFNPDKVLASVGLAGLKSVGVKLTTGPEGPSIEALIAAPEARRAGLLKILALETKDASPPSFIGADSVKYHRWRIDGAKSWSTIEGMLAGISPEISGLLQLGLATIGKDKDPNFDFRKSFVLNLGNDIITVQKAPRTSKLTDLDSPPALYLIASPQPEELLRAFRAATALLPPPMSTVPPKERDFQGKKIYSLPLADDPDAPAPIIPNQRSFNFSAANGYAAMSTDVAFLEEFLRGGLANAKALREIPGLAEASQKVGGTGTGLFGYENLNEATRAKFETLKNDPKAIDDMFIVPNVTTKINLRDQQKTIKEWFDISLLPPFEQISKYFYFSVFSGKTAPEGIFFQYFAPTPPGLK